MRDYAALHAFASAQSDLGSRTSNMLLCVALAAANDAKGVASVACHYLATIDDLQDKVDWVEYVRCALVKSWVLCSFPRSLNATRALVDSVDDAIRVRLNTTTPRYDVHEFNQENAQAILQRGQDLYNTLYAARAEPVKHWIQTSHPDLWTCVSCIYGYFLSDTTRMTKAETELLVIVNNQVMGADAQFADHLKCAPNIGLSEGQVQAATLIGAFVLEKAN